MTAEHRLKELDIALPAPPGRSGPTRKRSRPANLLFSNRDAAAQGRGAGIIAESAQSSTSTPHGRGSPRRAQTSWRSRASTWDLSTGDANRPPVASWW